MERAAGNSRCKKVGRALAHVVWAGGHCVADKVERQAGSGQESSGRRTRGGQQAERGGRQARGGRGMRKAAGAGHKAGGRHWAASTRRMRSAVRGGRQMQGVQRVGDEEHTARCGDGLEYSLMREFALSNAICILPERNSAQSCQLLAA
jgi:hypothetical protein